MMRIVEIDNTEALLLGDWRIRCETSEVPTLVANRVIAQLCRELETERRENARLRQRLAEKDGES
jgi:hypothetical protein